MSEHIFSVSLLMYIEGTSYTVNYTHTHTHTHTNSGSEYAAILNTDLVHVNRHDIIIHVILAKHCTRLPDDVSSVIRNMLEHF